MKVNAFKNDHAKQAGDVLYTGEVKELLVKPGSDRTIAIVVTEKGDIKEVELDALKVVEVSHTGGLLAQIEELEEVVVSLTEQNKKLTEDLAKKPAGVKVPASKSAVTK